MAPCPPLQAAAAFLSAVAANMSRWLAPQAWPLVPPALLADAPSSCLAEALPLLRGYNLLAGALHSWDAAGLAAGVGVAAAFEDVLQSYDSYLAYQTKLVEAGERLEEAERMFGLLLRSAWLLLGERRRVAPGHCACRDTPETQSMLFGAFGALRHGEKAGFGLFQCGMLAAEADVAEWRALLPLARAPEFLQCTPADVVVRLACAQQAAAAGQNALALRRMDAAANLMALALDCFEHTPWTGRGWGQMGEDLSAAEMLHNWARGAPWLPWQRLPAAQPRSFARGMCRAELGTGCVDLANSHITLWGEAGAGEIFLLQCGDSYGDWRRASIRTGEPPAAAGRGWLLPLSPLCVDNLWHLLHVLLPALVNKDDGAQILIDGLQGSEEMSALRGRLAWQLLSLLSGREPLILGEGAGSACYRSLAWGQDAVTLFGRDKGLLRPQQLRAALDRTIPHFGRTLPLLPHFYQPPAPRRVLYLPRPAGSKRAVVNEEEVLRTLRGAAASLAAVDFASEVMSQNAAAQLRLASAADVMVGPHGAALAWAAFMAEGAALIELMPHMQVLHTELCHKGWGATPMYAYGGLSLLLGLKHLCLLGLPTAQSPQGKSLAWELGLWSASPIRVDLQALAAGLQEALALQDS